MNTRHGQMNNSSSSRWIGVISPPYARGQNPVVFPLIQTGRPRATILGWIVSSPASGAHSSSSRISSRPCRGKDEQIVMQICRFAASEGSRATRLTHGPSARERTSKRYERKSQEFRNSQCRRERGQACLWRECTSYIDTSQFADDPSGASCRCRQRSIRPLKRRSAMCWTIPAAWSARAWSIRWPQPTAWRAARAKDLAIALEYFHTASLVFDDLPCMDNALERRGVPCVHFAFGEAGAILTALALSIAPTH